MKLLLFRLDNIGDLVCTTPLIDLLRQYYPMARLDIVVNTYNVDIIKNNPAINHYYVYKKSSHSSSLRKKLKAFFYRLVLIFRFRFIQYDYAIIPGMNSAKALRWAKACRIKQLVYLRNNKEYDNLHEVVRAAAVVKELGINSPPGKLRLYPEPLLQKKIWQRYFLNISAAGEKKTFSDRTKSAASKENILLAIHISSRLPQNRWPKEYFIELIKSLSQRPNFQLVLLWSPGSHNEKVHPGDDEKAQQIIAACPSPNLIPVVTNKVEELVAVLSQCDGIICGDGGAMHIAAALVKFMVVIFGKTNPAIWHPWMKNYCLLQSESKRAADVSVKEVLEAVARVNTSKFS